jgi:hypothetical protein
MNIRRTIVVTAAALVLGETGYTGHLGLSNVGPCLGQLQTGNPTDLASTLDVTSPDGAINVS